MSRYLTARYYWTIMSKKNILVVASHPDDEILGCGGSIDKFSKLGYKIYTLILGSGIDSRYLKVHHEQFHFFFYKKEQ